MVMPSTTYAILDSSLKQAQEEQKAQQNTKPPFTVKQVIKRVESLGVIAVSLAKLNTGLTRDDMALAAARKKEVSERLLSQRAKDDSSISYRSPRI